MTMCKKLLLLSSYALVLLFAGCKDDEKKKALAEAAQARAEAVKLQAEIVQLKGEASYLREQLLTANQAQDKLKEQVDLHLEEKDAVITEAQDSQQESDKLSTLLAEQTKKATELEKQVVQLKAVIRELQSRIDPNKPPEQSKETQQSQTAE